MHRFLVDEDVPRSTAHALRAAGYEAEDVRDVGLRGHSDSDVFAYAQAQAATLISCDKGFTNLLNFPVGSHAGIIVIRIPDEASPAQLNDELLRALFQFQMESLHGCLVIVEMGRVRLRRSQQ